MDEWGNASCNITWSSALDEVVLFEEYAPALLHFATACCILFTLLGIPGNLITIIALFRCKKVRNATAVFIINLSVSDLMFCCFNLPLAASVFWQRSWRHGVFLCQMFPLMRYGLLAVSLFTVLAITINRYVMISHPRLYPQLYRRQYLGLMVGCTWVFGFGALVATWLGRWGRFGLDRDVGSCSILPDAEGRSPKVFLFIVAFVIPCLAIVLCYARIFYIVRRTAAKSRRNTSRVKFRASASCTTSTTDSSSAVNNNHRLAGSRSSASCTTSSTTDSSGTGGYTLRPGGLHLVVPVVKEAVSSSGVDDDNVSTRSGTPTSISGSTLEVNRKRRRLTNVASVLRRGSRQGTMTSHSLPMPGKMTAKDKKLLKMILVIFASFLICYLPITLSKTFHASLDLRGLNIAGYILIYLTTCINPIIYVVMSSEYRQAYKNLVMCRSGAAS